MPPVPEWYAPRDGVLHNNVKKLLAMRLAGLDNAEIAVALKLSPTTLASYVYKAGKNGWLDDWNNAKEQIENQLVHKVIRNLDEGLDGDDVLATGMKARTAVALKVAEGTIFKAFGEQQVQVPQQTVVAVKIEMPEGPRPQMREDTTGGVLAYLEGATDVTAPSI